MAPPTGVLDGSPGQFYAGQSVNDPGLSRTAFGIPTGCANLFEICGGPGLTHYTWRVTFPSGPTPFAVTAFFAPTTAEMTWTPPIATGFLACAAWPLIPPLLWPGMEIQFAGLPVQNWYLAEQLTSIPSFRFSRNFMAPPDPNDLILTWLPGP